MVSGSTRGRSKGIPGCRDGGISSDDYSTSIRITYDRPETADEAAEREKPEGAEAERYRKKDLDTLRRLKAKYPEAP